MTIFRFSLVAMIALSLPTATFGQEGTSRFLDGNELYESCSKTAGMDASSCIGYIMGVADAQMLLSSSGKKYLCLPSGVTSVQLRDVVMKRLGDKPETRHWPASALVWNALIDAYPCKEPSQ